MTDGQSGFDKAQVARALEVSVHIGLAILLVTACLLILLPFIPMLAWGGIIAVATYPGFKKLQSFLGGRGGLAALLCTAAFLTILILPVVLLGESLAEAIQSVASNLKAGEPIIPPPPPTIVGWPLIGAPLNSLWSMASKDLTEVLRQYGPQIKAVLPGVLSASAGVGLTVLQLLLSILVAGGVLANAQAAYEVTCSLTNRLFGEKGPEFQQLMGATIRSVTFGILGVALIQSVLAAIGFLVAGLPGASLWAAIFLVAAVLQMGGPVLIPAVIYVFATASTTKAVIFLIWCVFVAVIDNVLKPMLLGRGVAVPIVVIFLGAIGGFVSMGIIGMFVGATVLSVGYKLFLAWLDAGAAAHTPAQGSSSTP